MKNPIPLLAILSASFVAAVPAPFAGSNIVAHTENVAVPNFGEQALKLRGALLDPRGAMGKDNANAGAQAAAQDPAAAAAPAAASPAAAAPAAAAPAAASPAAAAPAAAAPAAAAPAAGAQDAVCCILIIT